jgi:hypothetical protein
VILDIKNKNEKVYFMGLLARIFGKKKKPEDKRVEKLDAEAAKSSKINEEDSREISLEEVERELEEMSIAQPLQKPKPVPADSTGATSVNNEEATARARKEPEAAEQPKDDAEKAHVAGKQYHIKKHKDGWQIIADDADRATRVFPTQKEAIDYAKENDMDYLLYRADGKLRK